jgi:phosphohistidine phosphatase
MIIFVFIMKTLILVRHAKSSWDDGSLNDLERPLSKRGKHDAPLMGRLLMEKGEKPDLIVSSPAKRAFSTAKKIAAELGIKKKHIKTSEDLYLADINDFLEVISRIEDNIQNLMIFSHNFSITDFANFLTGEKINNIPTCGAVKAELDINSWIDIKDKKGRLVYFEYPKKHYDGI